MDLGVRYHRDIPFDSRSNNKSQRGLDSRYMISRLQPQKFNVLSLTTIATPHRGMPA